MVNKSTKPVVTRIYAVHDGNTIRLVECATAAQAVWHVLQPVCKVVSATELLAHIKAKKTIEKIGVVEPV